MQSYKIDMMKPTMFEVLGQEKIIQLSTEFYNRVYNDDDQEYHKEFRVFFEGRKKEDAILNQWQFFGLIF